jgi:hypothetical protein
LRPQPAPSIAAFGIAFGLIKTQSTLTPNAQQIMSANASQQMIDVPVRMQGALFVAAGLVGSGWNVKAVVSTDNSRMYKKLLGKPLSGHKVMQQPTDSFPTLQEAPSEKQRKQLPKKQLPTPQPKKQPKQQPTQQPDAEYVTDFEARIFGDAVRGSHKVCEAVSEHNQAVACKAMDSNAHASATLRGSDLQMLLDANGAIAHDVTRSGTKITNCAYKTAREAGRTLRRKLKTEGEAAKAEAAKAEAAFLELAIRQSESMQTAARNARLLDLLIGRLYECTSANTCDLDCGMLHSHDCPCPYGADCRDVWCDRLHPKGRCACVREMCIGPGCAFVHAPAPSAVPTCRVLTE